MAMTGLLLAGGRSTRMGRDKAWLEFEGKPLAGRTLRVLRSVCDEVLIASGDGERLGELRLPQVADVVPDAGPLAGIVAGLEAASHELVAVLAVDMPYASADVFRLLGERRNGEDAVLPVTARGVEPLHAIYSKAAALALRRAFEAGTRSVQEALRVLTTAEMTEEEWRAADPTARFAENVNLPEDLPT